MISMIAAVGRNMELGLNGNLIFSIKEDMKFFRETTLGHTIIMGRKTYNSLHAPLKNRENAVISRSPDTSDTGVKWFTSVEEAYAAYKDSNDEIFIIGGGTVYEAFLPYCDKIYLTEVDENAEADTFFPNFDKSKFNRRIIKALTDSPDIYAEICEYTRL